MITLIKDEKEYILDDGSIAHFIGDEGWGMEPLHRLSEHGPLQDGDTDRGYKAEARIGKLLFELVAPTRYDLYLMREQLMSLFNPRDNLKLRWTLYPTGLVGENDAWQRQFDVVYAGDMDFPSGDRQGYSQKVQVSLKASDPTCYNPDRYVISLPGGGGTGFPVNVIVPMTFGASTYNTILNINQLGNADEYPEITLVGPITNPCVQLLDYGEKIDFTGYSIAAGLTWVIDCRYGYKTVIELPSTSRLDRLTEDSDLASFRFRPGPNDVKITGTAISGNSAVLFKYYDRYLGV